jgi:hypothetical protein
MKMGEKNHRITGLFLPFIDLATRLFGCMEKIHFDAVKISGCIMDSGLIASLLSSY